MAFEIDPDRPDIPGIARILSLLGLTALISSVVLILMAFSSFSWVNDTYAMIGAVGVFVVAVMLVGQAKTIELLAVISARVKSRFAIDHAVLPQAQTPAPVAAERKPPAPSLVAKERVISIPEQVAREQGFVPNANRNRDFS